MVERVGVLQRPEEPDLVGVPGAAIRTLGPVTSDTSVPAKIELNRYI